MSIDDDPPEGGAAARPMWEALAAELRREGEDGDGRRAELLQLIARKLAAKALDGDLGAIKEIFDRMDGKSAAGSAPVVDRAAETSSSAPSETRAPLVPWRWARTNHWNCSRSAVWPMRTSSVTGSSPTAAMALRWSSITPV